MEKIKSPSSRKYAERAAWPESGIFDSLLTGPVYGFSDRRAIPQTGAFSPP
jgi:hypothetical protein